MRPRLASLALALGLAVALAVPAASSTIVSKPPDLGVGWFPVGTGLPWSSVYVASFVAPEGDTRPLVLGTWLQTWAAPPPGVRFEIWADAAGEPDPFAVLATTGPLTPAADGSLTYFEAPVLGTPASLAPGARHWFVLTGVGETGEGAYAVGGHTQNSVYPDDGEFFASNDPAGLVFDFGPTLPEMAFRVELGPEILLLDDGCGSVPSQFALALDALGLSPATTTTFDPESFTAALTGGTDWRLVLVDSYGSELSAPQRDDLVAWIQAGGLVAVDYWNLANEPSLVAALDAGIAGPGYLTPMPLHPWDAAHPLFNEPLPLAAPLSPLADPCDTDGAFFDPAPGGTAIGGYTPSPAAGEAAIVIGNSGRSVLLGEVLHVFAPAPLYGVTETAVAGAPPGEALARNTVHYLLDTYLFGNDFEVDRTCRWGTTVPPLVEICNGLDDDCDDVADDGNPGGGEACDTGIPGICAPGLTLCDGGGTLVCDQQVFATAELCNDLDDDCDGVTDDGDPEGGQACDTGLPGICQTGITACTGGALECQQTVFPDFEGGNCSDKADNDCDGFVDCDDSDCSEDPSCSPCVRGLPAELGGC